MAGLPWIKVDVGMAEHPKVLALAVELGLERAQAVGHMIVLWTSVGRLAPSGRIPAPHADQVLEQMAGWTGEGGRFTAACLACSLLDRSETGLLVHDWEDHAGAFAEKYRRDAERKRAGRKAAQRPQDVQRTSDGRPPNVRAEREREREKEKPTTSEVVGGKETGGLAPAVTRTLWAEMQRKRATLTAEDGTPSPIPEDRTVPVRWASWCADVSAKLGDGWMDQIFGAYCRWLRDKDFEHRGWPTPVFMSSNVWPSRITGATAPGSA